MALRDECKNATGRQAGPCIFCAVTKFELPPRTSKFELRTWLPWLIGPAGRGIPSLLIGNLLEVVRRSVRSGQVLRIGDDRRNEQPRIAVRLLESVEVLLQRGVLAVRSPVLPKVTGLHLRRHHAEIAVRAGCSARTAHLHA